MTSLKIRDLEAGYDDFLVLKGVDLTVEDSQIVCLIGPNGAGKSTVLKTIFGLLTPSNGTIEYNGMDIVGWSQKELLANDMAYILQRDSVFKDMTIRENLELGAYTSDSDFDLEARIQEMYDLFPILSERRNEDAKNLSGGERQMLEFARGLMLDPEMILLDEPTAGLAPKIIDQIFERIVEINERGVTILMVEQNIKTGLAYSDYAYVLENGQTRFDGPADSILDTTEIRKTYLTEETV